MEKEKWTPSGRARMDILEEVTSGPREREGIEGKDEAGRRDKWQRALERL